MVQRKIDADISQDEFVVLEVDGLRSRKELFKVVVLQIINAVTQDLYLSDRSGPGSSFSTRPMSLSGATTGSWGT
jgi:hypothetical protein